MEFLSLALMAIIVAATSYLIAAIGEHVVERAGVLNLGVEDDDHGGLLRGRRQRYHRLALAWCACGIAAGALTSLVFAFFALGLATNQVATGLALTIFGLGCPASSARRSSARRSRGSGHGAFLSGRSAGHRTGALRQNPLVYFSIVMLAGVWWFLEKSRAGLVLRAIGENHVSAYAIGLPVLKVRLLAVVFGGASAGLAGAFLSLVHTPLWSPA